MSAVHIKCRPRFSSRILKAYYQSWVTTSPSVKGSYEATLQTKDRGLKVITFEAYGNRD